MIPAPFRFLEVKKEEFRPDAAQFDETEFGITPEALDPVDVIFAAGKLVFVVMNAMMLVTAQDEAVVSLPAVGVDGGFGQHLPLDDRLQLYLGAVFDHARKDLAAAFEQSDDGRLAAGSASAFSSHSPWSEVGFINLNFPGEWSGFLHRHFDYPPPQQLINPLAGLAIDHGQLTCGECRHIGAIQLEQLLEFSL